MPLRRLSELLVALAIEGDVVGTFPESEFTGFRRMVKCDWSSLSIPLERLLNSSARAFILGGKA
jgi:hypothetical protein